MYMLCTAWCVHEEPPVCRRSHARPIKKTFEFLCFITGVKVTSERLEGTTAIVTFLIFKTLDLRPWRPITNSSGCNVGEIMSSIIAGWLIKVKYVSFQSVLKFWVGKRPELWNSAQKKGGLVGSSLLLYICFLHMATHRSTCIMWHSRSHGLLHDAYILK